LAGPTCSLQPRAAAFVTWTTDPLWPLAAASQWLAATPSGGLPCCRQQRMMGNAGTGFASNPAIHVRGMSLQRALGLCPARLDDGRQCRRPGEPRSATNTSSPGRLISACCLLSRTFRGREGCWLSSNSSLSVRFIFTSKRDASPLLMMPAGWLMATGGDDNTASSAALGPLASMLSSAPPTCAKSP
jgi:hypothetical protein